MASGSIRRRKGVKGITYQVVIELGTVAGKRKQKTATFKRRKDADEFLIRTLHELNTGAYIEPSQLPLSEYAPHWFDTITVRASSQVVYRSDYERHILPAFGDVALGAITTQAVQTWYNDLRRHYRSAPRKLIVLQLILKQAVRERLISVNPCMDVAGTERVTPPAASRITWTAAQVASFLETAHDDPDWPLWWVAFHTGLRPGELVALRWGDLDTEARTLHVERTQTVITKQGKRIIGIRAKTDASNRVIGIDPQTVLVLRGVHATQASRRRALGARWQDDDLVFDRGDGGALNANNLSARFTAFTGRLGYPRLTLQGARHTHGSLLAMSGRPLHYIQHRLGHASLDTTSHYYLHLVPGTEHEDAEAFADAIQAAKRDNFNAS